jgi:hypothetical protein
VTPLSKTSARSWEPHACLCAELHHMTRILLAVRAARTNIKADFLSLFVPRLRKSPAGFEKKLCVNDRAPCLLR